MLRHEFQPGKLIAGCSLLAGAVVYGGDASGTWDVAWFAMIPIVVGGLFLAGATGTVTYGVKHWLRSRSPNGSGPGAHPEYDAHSGSHRTGTYHAGSHHRGWQPSGTTHDSTGPRKEGGDSTAD